MSMRQKSLQASSGGWIKKALISSGNYRGQSTLTFVFGHPLGIWVNARNVKVPSVHCITLLLAGIHTSLRTLVGVAGAVLLSASGAVLATILGHR